MTRVKLGGRELSIADEQVAEYLAKGYSVIDSSGSVLAFGKCATYEQAIKEVNRLTDENKRLRISNGNLEVAMQEYIKMLEELKKENKTLAEAAKAKASVRAKKD